MSISALASYLILPRQTVSRRVAHLAERGMLKTVREGNRTIVTTTEKAKRSSLRFAGEAIAHTVDFVSTLDTKRPE